MSSPAAFTMSSPEPLPPLDPQDEEPCPGDKDERNGGSKLSGVEGNKLTARLVRFRVGRERSLRLSLLRGGDASMILWSLEAWKGCEAKEEGGRVSGHLALQNATTELTSV